MIGRIVGVIPIRLTNVSDAGNAAKGFKFTSGEAAYTYDLNGNLTQDNHKGLSLQYNYLNLPNYYSNTGGADVSLTYTADGEKLTKVSSAGTRNYISGIEYLGSGLDAIYHAEGRCTPNGASAFYYEYTIKDHLGNARINFRANGTAVTFLQELHYYPFGMVMEGIGTAQVTNNGYKYNGKELNEDLGLNLSDYGARWYDASLGRWWSVDPMAQKYQPWSGYNYGVDNPVKMIDPDGMQVEDHIFLDQKGSEVGRIVDPNVKLVSFVDWHAPQLIPSTKEELIESATVTYDMNGIISLYNESASDIVKVDPKTGMSTEPKGYSNKLVDEETGKPRLNVANEHGADLKMVNGVVTAVGDIPGNPARTYGSIPGGDVLGTVHTHPNEDKGALRVNDRATLPYNDNGPSSIDTGQSGNPQKGYYNIVVDNSKVYFYNPNLQNNKVISIQKSKL
jgi:RHS repeat-associated protein